MKLYQSLFSFIPYKNSMWWELPTLDDQLFKKVINDKNLLYKPHLKNKDFTYNDSNVERDVHFSIILVV